MIDGIECVRDPAHPVPGWVWRLIKSKGGRGMEIIPLDLASLWAAFIIGAAPGYMLAPLGWARLAFRIWGSLSIGLLLLFVWAPWSRSFVLLVGWAAVTFGFFVGLCLGSSFETGNRADQQLH